MSGILASGMVMDPERLVLMANQIGDFFAPYPPGPREEGIRNHLRTYWDPRMRAGLRALIAEGGVGLYPHVIAAAVLLDEPLRERKGYYGPPKPPEI